jgi:hypothetical protein
MTKMTHRTNPIVVVKEVDLDTSHIYSHNHMIGIDKISSSENFVAKLLLADRRKHTYVMGY